MPRPQGRVPSYRHHKARGLAVVRLNGVDHYLGKFGSPESRAEYDRLIAEWLANSRSAPVQPHDPHTPDSAALTVTELIARYWRFAESHYRRDGQPSRELRNIRDALQPVKRLYGVTPAAQFGPVAFKAVRSAMIEAGLSRRTILNRLGKVRRLFKWAVECELVPADVHHRLAAVAPLRPGRDGVREREPVKPVPDEHVEAVLPLLTPPVRAMVQVQRLSGARPGEVMAMTAGQIDRSGELWVYTPARHKTDWKGRERRIILGPKAQAIIAPWLKADPDAPLFSPREWIERHRAEKRARRKSPLTPSQRARQPKRAPKRAPSALYSRYSYTHAIHRACHKAGVPVWGPNRLRHAAASEIRSRFGLEAAQVILGHAKADVTQVYAQADTQAAMEVMRKIG